VDAGRGGLDGGRARHPLHEPGVPGGGHAELGRVDRRTLEERVAVDAVLRDQQGDAQRCAGDELVLALEVLR
jgi:hypothetical protein